ncbi:MAG: hypothetical protein AAF587_35275 [Bacteroidota bacterium]
MADSNGHFHFNGLCPGRYTLVCEHHLCEHLEQAHDLEDATWLFLEATDRYMDLATITMHSQRKAAEATQAVQRIGEQQLQQGLGQSLGDILSDLRGVNRLQTVETLTIYSIPTIGIIWIASAILLMHLDATTRSNSAFYFNHLS